MLQLKHYALKMYGEMEVNLHAFLNLILDGGDWLSLCFDCFTAWNTA
jgi:hypothetical protein